MTSTLFIALTSPFEKNSIPGMSVLSRSGKNGVLLFEDGIYYATHPAFLSALKEQGLSIYAHTDSCRARGFHKLPEGVESVDFDRAIDLIMEEYDTSITCVSGSSVTPGVGA